MLLEKSIFNVFQNKKLTNFTSYCIWESDLITAPRFNSQIYKFLIHNSLLKWLSGMCEFVYNSASNQLMHTNAEFCNYNACANLSMLKSANLPQRKSPKKFTKFAQLCRMWMQRSLELFRFLHTNAAW